MNSVLDVSTLFKFKSRLHRQGSHVSCRHVQFMLCIGLLQVLESASNYAQ